MKVPRILRWLLEAVTFVGVAIGTGCPHCAMMVVGTVGAVEYVCHD